MLDLSQAVPGGGNKAFPSLRCLSLPFHFPFLPSIVFFLPSFLPFASLSFLPSFFPVFSSFRAFGEGLPVLK